MSREPSPPSSPAAQPDLSLRPRVSLTQLIASGDEDAIAGFRDAHIEGVHAYCEITCAPATVDDAIEAVFVDFLGRVLAAPEAERNLDELLLNATRSAAAGRFRDPGPPPSGRGDLCAAVPELLAARASGELSGDDQVLGSHLRRCPRCQAAAALMGRADAAFRAVFEREQPEPLANPEPDHAADTTNPAPRALTPRTAPTQARTVVRRTGGLLGSLTRNVRTRRQQ